MSDKSICPNCGASVIYDASWPLSPTNALVSSIPDSGKLITGMRLGDLVLGFLAAWPLLFLSIYGLGFALGVYLSSRKIYPTFARGFGIGLIAMVVAEFGYLIFLFSTRTFD